MTVRAAVPEDLSTLVDYVIAEAREAEDRVLARATMEASIGAALADPALARYWIAEHEGESIGQPARSGSRASIVQPARSGSRAPIGAIAVTREWSDWCNGSYWYIQFVFVVPEHRGRGVLRELVDEVHAAARRDGAPELRLYVHPENARAIRAYEKLGFARLPYVMMALRS